MNTIPLTVIIDNLKDLTSLNRTDLEAMAVQDLRTKVAKNLGIPKGYKLRKTQLIDACWHELEEVRKRLALDEQKAKTGQALLENLKKDDNYTIPVTEVAESAYKRIREIAETGKDLAEMKESLNAVVASVARFEMSTYKLSTVVKSRRTDIKKAIQAMVDTESPLLQETVKVLFNYFYNQLLSFQREDSIELSRNYRRTTKGKNRDKKPIKITQLVKDCQDALTDLNSGKKPHWTKISIAIALGTGRRMSEIHALGNFEVTGEYTLYFSGQAKTRGAEGAKDSYSIPTLFPAEQIVSAWEYLESERRRLSPEKQLSDRKATNKTYNMALSRAMEKYPDINYKGLRAIYAECQWAFLSESDRLRTEKHIKYSDWLGHIDKDGANDTTFTSYMVYAIEDLPKVKTLLGKE